MAVALRVWGTSEPRAHPSRGEPSGNLRVLCCRGSPRWGLMGIYSPLHLAVTLTT